MTDNIGLGSINTYRESQLDNSAQNDDIYEVSQENFELLALTISTIVFCILKCLSLAIPAEYVSNHINVTNHINVSKHINVFIGWALVLFFADLVALTGAFLANIKVLIFAIVLSLFNFLLKIITIFMTDSQQKSLIILYIQQFVGISLILDIIEILILASLIYAIKNSDRITLGIHKSLIKSYFLGK